MFQPAPKRCFTIESLVAKDSPLPASRSEDPIRPAALSYANSSPINPFLNGFHSAAAAAAAGRGVYSNPDLVFAEAVSHPPNPACTQCRRRTPWPPTPCLPRIRHTPSSPLSSGTRPPSTPGSSIATDIWATASKLLRLEHAFEKNHYVVGAERKQLAHSLSLTETQVKVWFQNRRTKFKRQKLEEEGSDSQQKKKGTHHINRWRIATKQASPEEIDVTSDD
ncbi:LOW QUALITY PROTEIN: hypothetical protein MC885_020518 [Smutsia gigantea]|nr:LOW QUALITY PROTEIN: hypothetical protein MC885_020518 [Smutsia gigantea]